MFLKGSAQMFENPGGELPAHHEQSAGGPGLLPVHRWRPQHLLLHSARQLAENEVMVIDAPIIPECQTWNFQLDNWWMESPTAITHSREQAYRRLPRRRQCAPGDFHTDPACPTDRDRGHDIGTMCWRWIGADEHPPLNVRVMKLADLASLEN